MISFHLITLLPLKTYELHFNVITVFLLHKMAFIKHSTTDHCKYQRNTPFYENDLCKKKQITL